MISAYTGILIGNFADVHEYAEEAFGHPVWTHEFASKEVAAKLKELAKPDFLALDVEPYDRDTSLRALVTKKSATGGVHTT